MLTHYNFTNLILVLTYEGDKLQRIRMQISIRPLDRSRRLCPSVQDSEQQD